MAARETGFKWTFVGNEQRGIDIACLPLGCLGAQEFLGGDNWDLEETCNNLVADGFVKDIYYPCVARRGNDMLNQLKCPALNVEGIAGAIRARNTLHS